MSIVKDVIIRLVAEKVSSSARVKRVFVVSEKFRIIDLQADAFKKVKQEPGSKIGMFVGGHKRVYTPLSIDAERGLASLLIYLHADGPGSSWAASVKVSDECRYRGPTSSLELSALKAPCVLFGDETSFAVSSNLRAHLGGAVKSCFIFEVDSLSEARLALDAIGIHDALIVERVRDGSHLAHVAETVTNCLRQFAAKDLILTGCGRSIQTLRQSLNPDEYSYLNRKVKAYWSPGKAGLD